MGVSETLDYVPIEKYQEMVRMMEEFRASWFATLAILLLRNDLKVTVTPEEIEKSRNLRISKKDGEMGCVEFTGEFVEPVEEVK